jgi:hypothetical protein
MLKGQSAMFRTFRIAVCVATAWLAAGPGFAQIPGADDPDARELAAYQMTVPVLNKVIQASRSLAAAAKNDPRFKKQQALKAEIKKLEQKEEPTEADQVRLEELQAELETLEKSVLPNASNQSLSQMAAAMEKEPLFSQALASAGITAREYAKFLFSYLSAGMVAGMMEQGVIKEVPKELAGSINMENIKFVQAHKAELQAFQKEMQALNQEQ